jgi:hypothetical protein
MITDKNVAPILDEGEAEKAFAPYANEIGLMTRAWNGLHEELGQIFGQIICPANQNIPRAVWHSILSDKAQRDILRAAATAPFAIDEQKYPKAKADITWLLDKTQQLSEPRNNAVHAPIMMSLDTQTHEIAVAPNIFSGNPRARKLHGKNLLKQLQWYRAQAQTYRQFALAVWFHLRRDGTTWPCRPTIPTLKSDNLPDDF